MSAILAAVVFIKSVSGASALSGVATAKLDDEEYLDFQYKAFIRSGDMPSIEDLPISPLFGTVTGPCSTPSRSQDGGNYFTLSRKTYNAFTSTHVMMDVPCFYDPDNNRHSSVANATNGKAIFSTAGELFVGKKLVQIIASDIEWTYQSVEKATADEGSKGSWRKNLKSKRLDFEDKYVKASGNQKKRPANYHYDDYNRESSTSRGAPTNCEEQEEVVSRSTKFADAVSVVVNDKGKGREEDIEKLMDSHEEKSCEGSDTE
nr:14447_t:CDS:2 [Entrophospora candida]